VCNETQDFFNAKYFRVNEEIIRPDNIQYVKKLKAWYFIHNSDVYIQDSEGVQSIIEREVAKPSILTLSDNEEYFAYRRVPDTLSILKNDLPPVILSLEHDAEIIGLKLCESDKLIIFDRGFNLLIFKIEEQTISRILCQPIQSLITLTSLIGFDTLDHHLVVVGKEELAFLELDQSFTSIRLLSKLEHKGEKTGIYRLGRRFSGYPVLYCLEETIDNVFILFGYISIEGSIHHIINQERLAFSKPFNMKMIKDRMHVFQRGSAGYAIVGMKKDNLFN